MYKFLPKKYKGKWGQVFLVTSLVYIVLMCIAIVIASILAGEFMITGAMILVGILALIGNVFICLIGFLGAKHIFVMTSLSTLVGTFVGILTSATDSNGWEYFAAIMMLVMISAIGLILGGIIQIVIAINKALDRE